METQQILIQIRTRSAGNSAGNRTFMKRTDGNHRKIADTVDAKKKLKFTERILIVQSLFLHKEVDTHYLIKDNNH
jgi:hypothetical protein